MKAISIRTAFVIFVVWIAAIAFQSTTIRAQLQQQQQQRFVPDRGRPTGKLVEFEHQNRERQYRIHVPKTYDSATATPMVVCLHGGGGNCHYASLMGLTPVANRHNFIAVYPNAVDRHWNDGRDTKPFAEHDRDIDDADFLKTVVSRVREKYNIDSEQIFVMGPSNGGFMSQRLAMEQSETFSAAAILIATMGEAIKDDFQPEHPVSILYMNGTEDPLVPYEGGPLTLDLFPRLRAMSGKPVSSRGICIPTDEAVSLWLERNKIDSEPETIELKDKDPDDGSVIQRSLWTDGELGTAVALYKVVGGGHTIPGTHYLIPEKFVGPVNQDIDAFETIWQFFQTHRRKPKQ